VTEVTPGSDADKKGIRPGDELLTINGFTVDRSSAVRLKFAMYVFTPRSGLRVELRDARGKIEHLDIAATPVKHDKYIGPDQRWWQFEQQKALEELESKEIGQDLMIVRVPVLIESGGSMKRVFEKARNHKALIVDLRGTPGGKLDSLKSLVSDVFDRDVTIGDRIDRGGADHWTIKGDQRNAFTGKLIVLIDSESASAAEIFARTVQLQQRGTVLGDRSEGSVMEAQRVLHVLNEGNLVLYGDSVTVADIIMSDGKSLEQVGVEPDKTILPTAADLASNRDPVMAYAASLAGVTLSAEDAAKLFPKPSVE
jgi:C-terminal processing protease CtpA/Prc